MSPGFGDGPGAATGSGESASDPSVCRLAASANGLFQCGGPTPEVQVPPPQPGKPPTPEIQSSAEQERRAWTVEVAGTPDPGELPPGFRKLKPLFRSQRVPQELVWVAEVGILL